jgi:hypothetical protein
MTFTLYVIPGGQRRKPLPTWESPTKTNTNKNTGGKSKWH